MKMAVLTISINGWLKHLIAVGKDYLKSDPIGIRLAPKSTQLCLLQLLNQDMAVS
jgi:hypothetical protein